MSSFGPISNRKAVLRAIRDLRRDLTKTLESSNEGANIRLFDSAGFGEEDFRVCVKDGELCILASGELGFVYGIYAVSRDILGVTDFWFWNDQQFCLSASVSVDDDFEINSVRPAVDLRGWFINDEVLFYGWKIDSDKLGPWKMALESLLRAGGNMVIPGTGQVDCTAQEHLAAEYGLYLTQHHAEPLGAQMFSRAYPDLSPSYAEHPDLFRGLWADAIEEKKDQKTVWSLGFRGQGDSPFWEVDPRFETPAERGKLMGDVLRTQYDMVKSACPGAKCAVNLYGETLELFRGGDLKIPDDVIKIWADNGFGRMVSRRQGHHDPRVNALPGSDERVGANGIYYHASFYDLQAAAVITMLPNSSENIARELENVLDTGVSDFWLINCSAVKPHVYFLDLIAEIWRGGKVNVGDHLSRYVERYYGNELVQEIGSLFTQFAACAPAFGVEWDQHAGEQFPTYMTRDLISQYIKDPCDPSSPFAWVCDKPTLKMQVEWYLDFCQQAVVNYLQLAQSIEAVRIRASDSTRTLIDDSVGLQAGILLHCYQGAVLAAKALLEAYNGDHKKAFYLAGKARQEYENGNSLMRSCEHGKWHGFYKNDAQADLSHSVWLLETLMHFLRVLGDGPEYIEWQREAIYTEDNRKIRLLLTVEKHLPNVELWEAMDAIWGA